MEKNCFSVNGEPLIKVEYVISDLNAMMQQNANSKVLAGRMSLEPTLS